MVSHQTTSKSESKSAGTSAGAASLLSARHTCKIDIIFLSSPWEGPEYLTGPTYSLTQTQPESAAELFHLARLMTPNVAFYVPCNTVLEDIAGLLPQPLPFGTLFKTYKPIESGIQHLQHPLNPLLYKGRPLRLLIVMLQKKDGRNSKGHVTVCSQGGSHRWHIRLVDFMCTKPGSYNIVWENMIPTGLQRLTGRTYGGKL